MSGKKATGGPQHSPRIDVAQVNPGLSEVRMGPPVNRRRNRKVAFATDEPQVVHHRQTM